MFASPSALTRCLFVFFSQHSPPANLDADCTSNQNEHDNDLILPHRSLITPYKYLLFEQLDICYRSEGDGFPGLGCKHCAGTDGHKRWFPNSQESLYQTTFTRSIANHLKLCQHCPDEVCHLLVSNEAMLQNTCSNIKCSIVHMYRSSKRLLHTRRRRNRIQVRRYDHRFFIWLPTSAINAISPLWAFTQWLLSQ